MVKTALLLALALSTLGCGKIKSMLGKGDDGGASGGGVFGLGGNDGELGFLSAFEGQIDLVARGKVTGKPGSEPINLSLLVKDKKFRVDLPSSIPGPMGQPMKGFAVLDGTQQKAFVVTDVPKKMALVFDLNKTGEQLKGMSAGGGRPSATGTPKPPPKVTKTGRKDKVAGYTCEDWEITSDDGKKVALCVAKQGFSWLKIPMLGAPAEYAWMGELLDGSHVPLRAIVTERDGQEGGRLEVTKIEKKTLAANQFEIPPGYPLTTLEQMIAEAMSGLGGAGGRPGFPPGALPPGALPPGFPPLKNQPAKPAAPAR